MDPQVTVRKPFSRIEPPLFMWVFGQIVAANILTDLIIFKTCLNLPADKNANCTLLHTNSSNPYAMALEQEIQSHISGVMIFRSVMTTLMPAFTGLFLGTWSDKYGRRPVLIMCYFGPTVTFLLLTILCNYNVNVTALMLVFIPFALFGGWSSVILSSLCYITDTTPPEKRAMQMVLLEATFGFATFVGIFTGPFLLNIGGYSAVFGTAAASSILATIYIFFFLKETIAPLEKPKYLEIFNIYVVKDLIVTIFQKRVGYNRVVVWACSFALMIIVMVTDGDSSIDYLFASARLGWNVSDFANFSATSVALGIAGAIIATKLLQEYLGLSEMVVVMITNMFNITNQLIKSFTLQTWHLYLAAIFAMFNGVFSPMIRSVLSRSIPSHEVGKIFSVTVFVEMTAAAVASPFYNFLYSSYHPPVYPCPVWILSACFIALMTIVCYFIRMYEQSYREVEYNTQNNVQTNECEQ